MSVWLSVCLCACMFDFMSVLVCQVCKFTVIAMFVSMQIDFMSVCLSLFLCVCLFLLVSSSVCLFLSVCTCLSVLFLSICPVLVLSVLFLSICPVLVYLSCSCLSVCSCSSFLNSSYACLSYYLDSNKHSLLRDGINSDCKNIIAPAHPWPFAVK
jgi:hypothetical protein